jgi:methanogenic corrinoid protein MtbC1
MIQKEKFYMALSQGKMEEVKNLVLEGLEDGESPETVLNEGLIQAMDRV